jgi:hypothetical protein
MLYNLVLRRSCKHSLALAATVCALCIALAPTAKAQITWTITVNAPSSGSAPTYTLSCLASGTTHPPVPCPNTNPTLITVNRVDSVYWQIGSTSNLEMWIVNDDLIVDDASKTATHHHHAKKGTAPEQDGGNIDVNAPVSADKHKYSVFAYDLSSKSLYYDDPRIIIGGTGLEESLHALDTKCVTLRKNLEHNPEEEEEAGALCQQIEALQKSLESKKKK